MGGSNQRVNTEPIPAVLRGLAATDGVAVAEVEAPTPAIQLVRQMWFALACKPVDSGSAVVDTRFCSPVSFLHKPYSAYPDIPFHRALSCWIVSAVKAADADAEIGRDVVTGMDEDGAVAVVLDAAELEAAVFVHIEVSQRHESLGTDEAEAEADPNSVKTEGSHMEKLEMHWCWCYNQVPKIDVAFDPDVLEEHYEQETEQQCSADVVVASNFESSLIERADVEAYSGGLSSSYY